MLYQLLTRKLDANSEFPHPIFYLLFHNHYHYRYRHHYHFFVVGAPDYSACTRRRNNTDVSRLTHK